MTIDELNAVASVLVNSDPEKYEVFYREVYDDPRMSGDKWYISAYLVDNIRLPSYYVPPFHLPEGGGGDGGNGGEP
jgi:hypothetical protein